MPGTLLRLAFGGEHFAMSAERVFVQHPVGYPSGTHPEEAESQKSLQCPQQNDVRRITRK
jgi:hypothetical protein